MTDRRQFLGASLAGGLIWPLSQRAGAAETVPSEAPYRIERIVPTRRFDGVTCWCHPRAGIVPNAGDAGKPRVVMTMNTLHLDGSDVFKAMFGMRTDNLGKTWHGPVVLEPLAVRYERIEGQERPVAISDMWPAWHAKTETLLTTGHTVVYTPDWKVHHRRPRHTAYSTYDPKTDRWSPWKKLAMPEGGKYDDAGAGCVQRLDLHDGTILLPIYFRPPGQNSRVTVARCTFDGSTLHFQEHGNELAVNDNTRGLHEPSLAFFDDTYFLTIRNDKCGYVTTSQDGVNYQPMRKWTFDDGSDLGNYNTQQHWVTHSSGLYLVYTRRGSNNDHVFRHRAPLFMAKVDTKKLCVLRNTERILVPERGARLGNFGITKISDNETWVTVSEWMQPKGVEKFGSDGSVFVAKIFFES